MYIRVTRGRIVDPSKIDEAISQAGVDRPCPGRQEG
jgi:hypothetical protein